MSSNQENKCTQLNCKHKKVMTAVKPTAKARSHNQKRLTEAAHQVEGNGDHNHNEGKNGSITSAAKKNKV